MVAGERELYQRFADYDDEELLRILTAERAKYRREALAAAEVVLARRGVAPPPALSTALGPPAPPARGRAKSPYQFIDLCVDALLVLLAAWAMKRLQVWTQGPGAGLWGDITYYPLMLGVLYSAFSLRRRWRAKEWRD